MNINDDTRISDNLLIVNAVAMQTAGVGDYVYRVEHLFEAGSVEESAKYCLKALEIDKSHAPTLTLMNHILNLNHAPVSKSLNSYKNSV